jgi:protease IV
MRAIRWILVLGVLAVVAALWLRQQPRVEPGSALWVDLSGRYVEAPAAPLLPRLLGVRERSFASLLGELHKAERDARIAHVVLHIRDLEVGWAKAQELRSSIASLAAAGRHPIAYLEVPGFGANLDYYVASAAEEVHLAPGGGAPLIGLAGEYLFLGGLWDRLGIDLEVIRVGAYKGAAENLAGRKMSDAFRDQANRLLDSVDGQFVQGIAHDRHLDEDAVRKAIAASPSDPDVLRELGLVDAVHTRAELLEALGDPPVVKAADYAQVDPGSLGFDPQATFALIYGSGALVPGEGSTSRTGRPVFAADTVIEALEDAAEAEDVKAIVLRIDSPGGGSFPAELLWQAVRRVRAKKPVIVSCSDYAASGGYYVASASDAIVAEPATLTGSIGVFAVRPALAGLLDKLDIGHATLERAPHAELGLGIPPLSADTRTWLQSDVEAVYRRFVDRVAEGRGLEASAVDAVGEGRVFTGAEAVAIGLVDRTGGLRDAEALARERVGLAPDADVELAIYPQPGTFADQLRETLGASVARSVTAALPWSESWARMAAWLEGLSPGGAALVPPVWVEIH